MAFLRPLTRPGDDPYAFSFSGLMTAAARWVEQHRRRGEDLPVADGAAALQEAVAAGPPSRPSGLTAARGLAGEPSGGETVGR